MDKSVTTDEPCAVCRKPDVMRWKCLPCDAYFCDACWVGQVAHSPNRQSQPHEKVDTKVFNRIKGLFQANQTRDQAELHRNDVDTTWFSVVKQGETRDSHPQLLPTTRLVDIILDSDTGVYRDRYPQLVSFVGQTGAGKSTLIKMLMDQQRDFQDGGHSEESGAFQTPVSGVPGDCVPTTGDVHLYSDPFTSQHERPILYADCEGMSGGERSPRGLQAIIRKAPDEARAHLTKMQLRWANDAEKQTRQFSVMNLFPRILYTFSDVIVFVVREIKTFESEVLLMLVEWASVAVEKSINQPGTPHVIIAINACDTFRANPDTEELLKEYCNSILNVPKLQAIVDNLKESGINISSTKQLLEFYYSSVQVVHIPSASHQRYMELDRRALDLYKVIGNKCFHSFSQKRRARMELNTSRLVRFMSSAYDHFSRHLDKPFNFVQEALHHNPMPQGFEGHVLNLILTAYMSDNEGPQTVGSPSLLDILHVLSPRIASCVMLAAARGDYKCSYSDILRHNFYASIRMAFDNFVHDWLRCGFHDGEHVCQAVKRSHRNHHQDKNGKFFQGGQYSNRCNPNADFESWMQSIEEQIHHLKRRLNRSGADRVEEQIVWPAHCSQINDFYKNHPSLDQSISHATCLCCVNNIPNHVLPCGHVLCDECVVALGEKASDGRIELSFCPLHSTKSVWRPEDTPVKIRFKPREAGTRILCLDGGGVRGIVELVILKALEKELGNLIPIRNFFDLMVGTSTGGIIVLGLGVKNLSVGDCIDKFKSLCGDAFLRRYKWRRSALFFSQSIYRTQPLESALQSIFDKESLLFGTRRDSETPFVRVAVTTATALDYNAALFSNYNGDNSARKKHDYRLLREQNPSTEAKIWEAARATSAAPPFFKPFPQRSTGDTFIDGAINHNCPVRIAHQEQRLIWGDVDERPPDILLSIGTGLVQGPVLEPKTKISKRTGQKSAGFNLRYLWSVASRMIDNQLDTEAIWRDYKECVRPRHGVDDIEDGRRQMRINVEFPLGDPRPGLDEIEKLNSGYLEKKAKDACEKNADIKEAAHRLVASSFYFETEKSCRNEKTITFYGAIKCRFEQGSDIKGLGKFLRSCIRPLFRPYFLLQNDYVLSPPGNSFPPGGTELPIPLSTLDDMENFGTFHMPLDISLEGRSVSSPTRLAIRLQEGNYSHYIGRYRHYSHLGPSAPQSPPYLSIGGFPRVLLAPDRNKEQPPTPRPAGEFTRSETRASLTPSTPGNTRRHTGESRGSSRPDLFRRSHQSLYGNAHGSSSSATTQQSSQPTPNTPPTPARGKLRRSASQ